MKKSSHKNTQKRKLLKRKTTRKNTRKNQKRRGGGWFSSSKPVDNNNKNCKKVFACKPDKEFVTASDKKVHYEAEDLNKGEIYILKKHKKDFEKKFTDNNKTQFKYKLYTFGGFPEGQKVVGGVWDDDDSYEQNNNQKKIEKTDKIVLKELNITNVYDMTHNFHKAALNENSKANVVEVSREDFQKQYVQIIVDTKNSTVKFQTYGKCTQRGIPILYWSGDRDNYLPKC